MISREDFIVWQKDHVTKTFMNTIIYQIEGLKEELAVAAGKDQFETAARVGAIRALRDVLSYHMDDLEEASDA